MSLSEQQLVDCNDNCYGCDGGYVDGSYQFLISRGSISEDDYPYTSGNGKSGKCQAAGKKVVANVSGDVTLPRGSESSLQVAVAEVGPVPVAIDAGHYTFQMYSGGVYYEPNCSSYSVDHAVLVTGYGSYVGDEYWMVKNSWGVSWGLEGYIMMSRNKGNNCAIATDAVYPVV